MCRINIRMGLIAALLIALMALMTPALAEEDLSGYRFDELLALQSSLEEELLSRPEYVGKALSEGDYVAGKDFPAGTYELTLNRVDAESDSVHYYVYETHGMYKYDVDRYWLGDMPLKEGRLDENGSVVVDLYDGYCLVAYYNGINIALRGGLEGNPNDGYEQPDGTVVPVGFYTVGEEIPAGTFSVMYAGKASARYRVYGSMEDAKNDFADENVAIIVSNINPSGTVYLKEGQVVRVEYNDVIMKKSDGLVFD